MGISNHGLPGLAPCVSPCKARLQGKGRAPSVSSWVCWSCSSSLGMNDWLSMQSNLQSSVFDRWVRMADRGCDVWSLGVQKPRLNMSVHKYDRSHSCPLPALMNYPRYPP